jgi:two-component system, NarL family, sensor histidine kinase UhpB
VNVLSNAIIIRDAQGKPNRVIGYMQDVSKKIIQQSLKQQLKLKKEQIEEAKIEERSCIGKELHDNVNQLLAASKMYVEMAKKDEDHREMYLSRSSEYTLTAIDEIKKLTKRLTTHTINSIGLSDSINKIVHDIMEVSPLKIFCSMENFKEDRVNNHFKTDVFRIVQEELNNILAHANATNVTIGVVESNESIILYISDNGVGCNLTKKRKGIGMDNIKSRAMTYNGTAEFISETGKGSSLTVTFPMTEILLNRN